jgi:hypothetical protein
MKRLLVVGVILLFLGSSIPVLAHSNLKIINPANSLVFHHTPEDGVYYYGNIIWKASNPIFLIETKFFAWLGSNVTGENIRQVEFFFNGYSAWNETSSPYGFYLGSTFMMYRFSTQYHWGTKVYMNDGQIIWDNFSVYRIF